jgi:hypothetical protein
MGDYGHPYDNFKHTAALLNGYFQRKLKPGEEIEPEDVGMVQILLKISRETNVHKRDNLVDICGYAKTIELSLEERDRRANLE